MFVYICVMVMAKLAAVSAIKGHNCKFQTFAGHDCDHLLDTFETTNYHCETRRDLKTGISSMMFSSECRWAEAFDQDKNREGYEDNCRVLSHWSQETVNGECERSTAPGKTLCYNFDIGGLGDDLNNDVSGVKFCAHALPGELGGGKGRMVDIVSQIGTPVAAGGLALLALLTVGALYHVLTKKTAYAPVVDVV